MRDTWVAVRDAASRLTTGEASAVRLGDLSIAAASACRFGMPTQSTCAFDGFALRDALHEIALHALPVLAESIDDWNRLAHEAENAARGLDSTLAIDAWVACSQAATAGRKIRGAYATPMPFARLLARAAVGHLRRSTQPMRVVDPSAGAGALLLAVLQVLARGADKQHLEASVYALHGVEVDPAARELCCLLLWVAAARAKPSLKRIAANVVVDN